MRNREEAINQECFFKWVSAVLVNKIYGAKWIHAVPNGGARDIITGAILKRQGVIKGIFDIDIPIPAGKYHGMRIEFKSSSGILTKEQAEFMEYCDSVDIKTAVVRSWTEAANCVCEYLDCTGLKI